jgi:hypothetical protein
MAKAISTIISGYSTSKVSLINIKSDQTDTSFIAQFG